MYAVMRAGRVMEVHRNQVLASGLCLESHGETIAPVIVIPAADWREIAEALRQFECEYFDDDCTDSPDEPCSPCRIRSIIQRTEAENA